MMDVIKPDRDPLQRSISAQIVEEFVPMGSKLRLETNSREILEACRTSFGRYGIPAPGSGAASVVVRLFVDPTFTDGPPWPDPVFRGQEEIFYISAGRQNIAVALLESGFATGFIAPEMARDAVFLRNTFLECLVLTMLTHGKLAAYTYAHASAVTLGNKGLLFCGPSQAGKSTLAYACARRGFQVVSDDVVYLRDGEEGLTVWGKPWHLRLLQDCTRFFPELEIGGSHLRFDGKDCLEIDLDGIRPGHTRTRCRPKAVFFLERSAGRSTYQALEPHLAIKLLARDLVHDNPEALKRHERFWLELVRQGAYTLRFGEDLDAAVDMLERFLKSPPPRHAPV
jgi:hypothetical protein